MVLPVKKNTFFICVFPNRLQQRGLGGVHQVVNEYTYLFVIHKTLLKYSLQMHWILVKFYEMGDTKKVISSSS